MKNKISGLLKILLAAFVLVSGFSFNDPASKNVLAQESQKLVDFEIDEETGSLKTTFNNVGRFSRSGLAIVEDNIGGDHIYGLINIEGKIVAEIKYDYIHNFDENYYQFSKDNGETLGLLSKQDGREVLSGNYLFIPRLEEGVVELTTETRENEDKSSYYRTLKHYSHEEGFSDVFLPEGLVFSDFTWFNTSDYKGLKIMTANVANNTYLNWIINDQGDAVSNYFEGWITHHFNYNEVDYFTVYTGRDGDFLTDGAFSVSYHLLMGY